MKQCLLILTVVLACAAVGPPAADAVDWNVFLYLEETRPTCSRTTIEMELHSGDHKVLSTHVVSSGSGTHDSTWHVSSRPGEYTVEFFVSDCGGIRGKVASLTTDVTKQDLKKQLYLGAVVKAKAYDLRYVEINSYRDGQGTIVARRERSSLVLTNASSKDLSLCANPMIISAADEYFVNGEWRRQESWVPPDGMSGVASGAELKFGRGPVRKYIPPGEVEPIVPESVRVLLSLKPDRPSHVKLGKLPRGAFFGSGCQFLYVERPVAEWDRLWPLENP